MVVNDLAQFEIDIITFNAQELCLWNWFLKTARRQLFIRE